MNGTMALALAEVRRLGRNKRYSIFSVALPMVLYLVVAPQARHASAYGVGYAAYMIAMASIGAFSGALTTSLPGSPAAQQYGKRTPATRHHHQGHRRRPIVSPSAISISHQQALPGLGVRGTCYQPRR